ncbi:hypothetical protein [Tenacibaculum xiamenense]|uniref:hypothetical protein n=1 Tax=Tenacibaculum xiamenense TaxID=1261553 RepID=UPI0038B5713E
MSCKSNLVLISSIKETVIPGRPNIPSYSNYIVNFKMTANSSVNINRVEIKNGGKCYICNYLLKKQNGASYLKELSKQGDYILEIPLNDKYIISDSSCDSSKEQLLIYYREDGKENNLTISEFLEKTKTMR